MIHRKEQKNFYVEMGFRLKQIRQMRRLSQNDIALALGLVAQTIQKYESGEIRMQPEVIQACSRFLKVPIGYFYGEDSQIQEYSRVSLMIASEIMLLSSKDAQKHLYHFIKSINDNKTN